MIGGAGRILVFAQKLRRQKETSMPYIAQTARDRIANSGIPLTPGDLNYIITTLCIEYIGSSPSYETYNSIIGVLECAKIEFYRRAVAVYEDKKLRENGDVYAS
jgi:hypothetical protein